MRRTRRIGALAAVVATGTGAAVAAGNTGGEPGVEVINATRVEEGLEVLDLGPSGPSLGDVRAFNARFEAGGRTVGYDGGTCTFVRPPAIYQCSATNVLPKGQLTTQALVDFNAAPGPFRFAITGGTDGYRTARGEVEVLFGATSDQVSFRIVNRRPPRH